MKALSIQGILPLAVAALLVVPAFPSSAPLSAQDGRFRVLIPDFTPLQGADDNFGEDTADELRDLMSELSSHVAIEKDEIEDQLDRIDMDMDELNCISTRQLGSQMNAQVAMCAEYTESNEQVSVNIEFWDLASNQSFSLDPFTIHEDRDEEAAQQIVQGFQAYVQQLQYRTFCFQSREDALSYCERVLEENPGDTGVRQRRARIIYEAADLGNGEYDEEGLRRALAELEQVVEADPVNENALQLAGFIATQLGEVEEGRQYYNTYLQLNPGDMTVRRHIAYQMYEAGDPAGAVLFVQEGLEVEENPQLYLDVGNYAFSAAAELRRGSDTGSASELSPEVEEMYRTATDAYLRVFEAQPDSMSVSALRNVVNAFIQLDEPEEAVSIAERIVEERPDEAGIWWAYAQALQRLERTDEAIEAMQRVADIDPTYRNVWAVQGQWLLGAGEVERATEMLHRAVDQGGQDPNAMARVLLADASQNGIRQDNYAYAMERIEQAKTFDVGTAQQEELDFWHGYALFQQAVREQEPSTLATARATLPKFQRAKGLLQAGRPHAERTPGSNYAQIIENIDRFIEIQEAIIRRGGGDA